MENVNSTATTTQKQQQQHFQLQQHQQEQQQQHEHQQQFCLRWHNHQTSLLSTLPILLDQSHLTDVTISAEGRTLRAHRVVLSACSSFFLELFRALDTTNHPVIVLPGASFAAIVALLTFMYSGEVNVYEEQIPVLLNLAETLGVKGLTDGQNEKSTTKRRSSEQTCDPSIKDDISDGSLQAPPTNSTPTQTPPPLPPPTASLPPLPQPPLTTTLTVSSSPATPTPTTTYNTPLPPATALNNMVNAYSFANPLLAGKFPSQLENFFLKSLQFYPNLLPQPLNFSQTALNKTSELLAKYQQQCNLYQGALNTLAVANSKENTENLMSHQCLSTPPSPKLLLPHEDPIAMKRFCMPADKMQACNIFMQQPQKHHHQHHQQQQQYQVKDIKRIDKIVDTLRGNSNSNRQSNTTEQLHNNKSTAAPTNSSNISQQSNNTKSTSIFTTTNTTTLRTQSPQQLSVQSKNETTLDEQSTRNLQQQIEQLANCGRTCFESFDGNQQQLKSPSPLSAASNLADKFHTTNTKSSTMLTMPTSPGVNTAQGKTPSNSKLYATCFICHKQLSNQYNLRVHLETHQNVRYACNVCSHVSRSKDALRKHVSYRHPGAPSPCETEARRKRATKMLMNNSGNNTTTTSPPIVTTGVLHNAAIDSSINLNNNNKNSEAQVAVAAAAAQLNSAAAYMFLPNQYHLAAAAAAVVQQQQQQQQQTSSTQALTNFPTTSSSNIIDNVATLESDLINMKNEQHSSPEASASPQLITSPVEQDIKDNNIKDVTLNVTHSSPF